MAVARGFKSTIRGGVEATVSQEEAKGLEALRWKCFVLVDFSAALL